MRNNIPGMPGVPGGVPMLGQKQQQQQMALAQAVSQLSLSIYQHSAIQHVTCRDEHQQLDPERLRQLAKDSQVAAKDYFEGLGIAQFFEPGEE